MRVRLAWLLLLLSLVPATAYAQTEEGDPTEDADADEGDATEDADADADADEGGDADAQANEGGDGYEPDQRGYEPDQRGYEPDQRGNEDGANEEFAGDEAEYEPDQRGNEEQPEPPTVGSADAVEQMRVSAEDDEGYGAPADYGAGFGIDLRLWLGGAGSVLEAFEGDNLLREEQRGGFGGSFGLTLGLRVGPVTIGPRHTIVLDGTYALATFGIDFLLRLLPERFSPYVRVALSYALTLSFADSLPSQGNANGVLSELGVGLGGRVLGPMTIGVEVSGGWLALYRGDVPMCEAPCSDADVDLTRSGQAHGMVIRGLLWIGLEL